MKDQAVILPTGNVSLICPLCNKKVQIPMIDCLHNDVYVCPACKQSVRSADIRFETPDLPSEIRDTAKY